MKTESAIYLHLKDFVPLTDIVSTRIFPVIHELDAAFPSVVYRRLGSDPVHAMGGDANLRTVTMAIACLAETFTLVKDTQEQVEAALRGYEGTMGGVEGVPIQKIFLANIMDDYEDDMKVFVTYLEFEIWAEEA